MDLFRRLCLWFLLLSLPLQGLAAATLRHCPQGANHAVVAQADHADQARHAGHAHQAHLAHHADVASHEAVSGDHHDAGAHPHDLVSKAMQAGQPDDASVFANHGQAGSDHGCSLCALCGASAALRSVQASGDFGSTGIVAAPEPSARWQGVTTRLPDKPPRG